MARYVDAIDLPVPIDQAFDYLADFSNTAEWDPGVVRATKLTPGPVESGSRFEVVVSFLGQELPFEYAVETCARPHRIVFRGGSETVKSFDVLSLVSTKSGSRLTYVATLELSGLARLADPILHLLFQQIGREAVRGLRARFADAPRSERRGTPVLAAAQRAEPAR